jgi:hypothetical protein
MWNKPWIQSWTRLEGNPCQNDQSHVMGLDLGHSYGIYQVDQNLPLYPKFFFTTSILDESPMARITTMVRSVKLKLINY